MALHGPVLTEPVAEPERLQPDTHRLTVPVLALIALVPPNSWLQLLLLVQTPS